MLQLPLLRANTEFTVPIARRGDTAPAPGWWFSVRTGTVAAHWNFPGSGRGAPAPPGARPLPQTFLPHGPGRGGPGPRGPPPDRTEPRRPGAERPAGHPQARLLPSPSSAAALTGGRGSLPVHPPLSPGAARGGRCAGGGTSVTAAAVPPRRAAAA